MGKKKPAKKKQPKQSRKPGPRKKPKSRNTAKERKTKTKNKEEKTIKHEYSGFIIVRISQELLSKTMDYKTLAAAAKELKFKELGKILGEYDLPDTNRLIHTMDPEKVVQLEREVEKSDLPPLHSLASYWRVDSRRQKKQMKEIAERLNRLKEVDLAYMESTVSHPIGTPTSNLYDEQGYLKPAPEGIDAEWAWQQPNTAGAGVGFVDLEEGWNLNHEDFGTKSSISCIYGDNWNNDEVRKHGTAVLGIVIADDNNIGVTGIAHAVSSVRVISHYEAASDTNYHVADAILSAIPVMDPGDVLLLEVQRSMLPTEIDDADFDAIRLACDYDIIVIEAAGNANYNLDNYRDFSTYSTILRRESADFRESGAIMVGAAESDLPHNRYSSSNYGSRIDCYAWGNNVATCGWNGDLYDGGGDVNRTYTNTYSGTSSASAIIAGAALIVQGIHKASINGRLSPSAMRVLLSDPASGTSQGNEQPGHIGVMPDLQAIIS